MKVSDYVFQFLKSYTETVFLLSGGGIMHLVDSLGKSKLQAVCCHHEQACVIAAEGYSRFSFPKKIGTALVTTGPGGANAVTGIAGAWLDSIPLLVIGGQVKRDDITPRKNGKPIVRAVGFQELNVIDLVQPITKYAVTVFKPEKILYHLEKAIFLATSGRPGPVFVEIPLDVQAAEIEPQKLKGFKQPSDSLKISEKQIKSLAEKLRLAEKPLLLVGNGIRLAGAEQILRKFIKKTKINVVTTIFTADDLVPSDCPSYLGRQGIPGNKTANFAVDNCDLLLVIGDRLQLTQTSYDYQNFAKKAFKVMVDIDQNELKKNRPKIDLPIRLDAKVFLERLSKEQIILHDWFIKRELIKVEEFDNSDFVNVYRFMEALGKQKGLGLHIVTANGMASLVAHQALRIHQGQRLITNAGLGHMGSGLPLAIGACFASGKKPIVCFEGDGSLMLCLHELQTVIHHRLPIKLFIFNNNGYYSIRNTHLNYFQKVFAADKTTGVSLPDYAKLIPSFGFKYVRLKKNQDLEKLKKIKENGSIVFELMIDPDQKMPEKWSAGKLWQKKQ